MLLFYIKVKVTLSLCLTKHHAMKTYGEVETAPHILLTFSLDEREWSASRSGRFISGETFPGTDWREG
jgi:hypothetical protein